MANIDNLLLEHMRAIRADLGDIRETQREHGHRLTRIEGSVAGLRRDQAGDAEDVARIDGRFDRIMERIDRIERRLEIAE